MLAKVLFRLIGPSSDFPLEHRIFNIIALIGMGMSFTASIINYFINLGLDTVLINFACGLFALWLYYLSRVKRLYTLPVYITVVVLSFIFFPTLWLINGGTFGSIPYYTLVQGGIIAILLTGRARKVFLLLFLLVVVGLIKLEYHFPHLITNFQSNLIRYLDISLGYLIVFLANTTLFVMVIRNYNQERERARHSERKYRELADTLPQVIFEVDPDGKLVYVNKTAASFFGKGVEELLQANLLDFLAPEDRDRAREDLAGLTQGENQRENEYYLNNSEGKEIPVLIKVTPIFHKDKVLGFRGFIVDITERKKSEKKLQYLSHYDYLTGLRNRHGFEHDSQLLLKRHAGGIGIIVCDVDGLKLVNDTIGHDVGDKLLQSVAQIIKNSVREDDITARVGGDEFCIVVPFTRPGTVENIVSRLQQGIKEHNMRNPILPLSVAIGYAVSQDERIDIEALFKEADDAMYRQKLHHNLSTRSIFMENLMKKVEERGYIDSEQVERIQHYTTLMAAKIGLAEKELDRLLLLAKFHDIGMISLPEYILNKREGLTEKERKEIERHCEIGYRIAKSIPGLSSIAELILKHHEWWNGQGYPLKIKGEEIPLECRIFSIVMAYDAMTTGRPHRPPMSHGEAVAEIEKNAGGQFDPNLGRVFIEAVGKAGEDPEEANMP